MQFVVTHLTRMREGICTAGPEVMTGATVRLVIRFGSLSGTFLSRAGGPLEIGAVVDIGIGLPKPSPPHIEDTECDPARWRKVAHVSEARFVQHLETKALPDPYTAMADHSVKPGPANASCPWAPGSAPWFTSKRRAAWNRPRALRAGYCSPSWLETAISGFL